MARINIDVDVELHDFDTGELLDELTDRYSDKFDKKEIDDWYSEIIMEKPIVNSLIDQIKLDVFLANIDKIKLSDLEKLI